MARARGIIGFEAGDLSGLSGLGVGASSLINNSAAARSSNYRFNAKVTVATTASGLLAAHGFADPASGELFDHRFRLYFKPITYPSVSGLYVGGLEPWARLEMDTVGALRLTGSGFTPTAYAGATSLGAWYRAECRFSGLMNTDGKTNSGRFRSAISVYDDVTGLLVASFETDQSPRSASDSNCTANKFRLFDVNMSFATVASKVTNYKVTVSGKVGGSGDGDYTTVISETTMEDGGCSGAPGAGGTFVEHGTLVGVDLSKFIIINSTLTTPSLLFGQNFNGPSGTREIDYDDGYYDFRTASDATDNLAVGFPLGTRVFVFPVTGQGASDQFTPTSGWQRVDEIPMDNVETVSSSTLDHATTYAHAPLAALNEGVFHIRCWANAGSDGSSHKLLIGSDEFSFTFSGGITDQADLSTRKADKSYGTAPLNAAAFAALAFGGKVGTGGSTFTIKNILLEVLVDVISESLFDPDAIAVIGLTWMSMAIAPRHAGVDALQQLVATRQAELADTSLHTFEARDAFVVTLERAERGAQVFVRYPQFGQPHAVERLWARLIDLATRLAEETTIDLQPAGGERYRLAASYHEAGHVVAARALGIGVRRSTLTVARRFGQVMGGETSYALDAQEAAPVQTLLRHALIARIGPLTPAVLLGHRVEQFGGADDVQIERTLQWLGLGEAERREAHTHLTALAHAFLHVAAHAAQIEAVACALLEQRTLTGQAIDEICTVNGVPLRAWALPGALLPSAKACRRLCLE